jgi:hypothetical protein
MPAGADPVDIEAFSTGTFLLLEGTEMEASEPAVFGTLTVA